MLSVCHFRNYFCFQAFPALMPLPINFCFKCTKHKRLVHGYEEILVISIYKLDEKPIDFQWIPMNSANHSKAPLVSLGEAFLALLPQYICFTHCLIYISGKLYTTNGSNSSSSSSHHHAAVCGTLYSELRSRPASASRTDGCSTGNCLP